MKSIKEKAQKLVDDVNAQIEEARQDLAKQMVEKGYTPESHKIYDNMVDIIEGRTLEYRCWVQIQKH